MGFFYVISLGWFEAASGFTNCQEQFVSPGARRGSAMDGAEYNPASSTTQESHALAWFFYVLNLLTLYPRNGLIYVWKLLHRRMHTDVQGHGCSEG